MALSNPIADLIYKNIYLIIIFVVIFIIALLIFKKIRPVPREPDYMKIFHESSIKDHALNKPDKKYGLNRLYRGNVLLGKIIAISELIYNTEKGISKSFGKFKIPSQKEKIKVFTVTFRRPFLWLIFFRIFWKKEILRFTESDDFNIENRKLVFPEYVAFDCLGKHYITANSVQTLSRIIEGDFMKFLFGQETNLMASEMSKISATKAENAILLKLKELEIERIKAEKQGRILSA